MDIYINEEIVKSRILRGTCLGRPSQAGGMRAGNDMRLISCRKARG
jgi:hypothetical protein